MNFIYIVSSWKYKLCFLPFQSIMLLRLLSLLVVVSSTTAASKPNVLIIVADDLVGILQTQHPISCSIPFLFLHNMSSKSDSKFLNDNIKVNLSDTK